MSHHDHHHDARRRRATRRRVPADPRPRPVGGGRRPTGPTTPTSSTSASRRVTADPARPGGAAAGRRRARAGLRAGRGRPGRRRAGRPGRPRGAVRRRGRDGGHRRRPGRGAGRDQRAHRRARPGGRSTSPTAPTTPSCAGRASCSPSTPSGPPRGATGCCGPAVGWPSSVWGPRDRNPWLGLVFDAVTAQTGIPVPPPGMPGPVRARPTPVGWPGILTAAGFADVRIEEVAVLAAGAVVRGVVDAHGVGGRSAGHDPRRPAGTGARRADRAPAPGGGRLHHARRARAAGSCWWRRPVPSAIRPAADSPGADAALPRDPIVRASDRPEPDRRGAGRPSGGRPRG